MEGFIKNRLSYFEDPLTSLHAMHALGNTLTHDIFIVYIYVCIYHRVSMREGLQIKNSKI